MTTNGIESTRSDMEELPLIRTDMFRPRIKHFLDKLTAEQWQLLLFNSPDEPLTFLTAELLTNLWTLISNTIMSALQNTCEQLSKEKVSASLGDVLPQTFADELGVEEEVKSENAEKLRDIMATEVTDAVNSSLVSEKHKKCIPSTCRLSAMLSHFFAMLKNMMAKVKRCCANGTCQRRKDNQPLVYDSTDTDSRTKLAEGILKEKMNSFMDQVEPEDSNSRPSEEIEKVAGEVAKDLTLYKTPRRRCGVAQIKLFTTKNLAKACLGRTLKWLAAANGVKPSPRESSNVWMERMYDRVETVIGNQVSETTCKELTDDAYNYICGTEEVPVEAEVPEKEVEGETGTSQKTKTYNEIWRSIMSYLAVLKWWEKTQADSHARKIVEEVESTLSSQTTWEELLSEAPEPPEPPEPDQERDMRRMAVQVFVQKLVCRTFSEAEVNTSVDNFQPLIERLSDQIWDSVKDVTFVVTQKNFKDLDKKVYKDLCDRWGCAEVVLVHLNIKDTETENLLAASFEEHLISPQKKRGFCSIFCVRS